MAKTTDNDLFGNAKAFAQQLHEHVPEDVKFIMILARADGKYICLANAPKDLVSRALRTISQDTTRITLVN